MRAALAVVMALLISGPALSAEPAAAARPAGGFVKTGQPMQVAQVTTQSESAISQRASVPRTTGTGLSGIPSGGGVMGMSPAMATLLGIVIVGGVAAIVVNSNDDDEPAPAGTGTGGT